MQDSSRGSGLGDAIVGFLQGDPGRTQIAAAAVDAPPLEFAVQTPLGFVRSKTVKLTWDPARNALGAREVHGVRRRSAWSHGPRPHLVRLGPKRLDDGRLECRSSPGPVGQRSSSTRRSCGSTASRPGSARRAREGAGCGSGSSTASRPACRRRRRARGSRFGDGKRGRGTRVVHRYKRPGTFTGDRGRPRPGRQPQAAEARVRVQMRRARGRCAAARRACAPAAPAGAAYEPGAQLVSASPDAASRATRPRQRAAISGDGRYVAFQTRARNFFADDDPDPPGAFRVGGVFRRDLEPGALELVADGDVQSTTTRGRSRSAPATLDQRRRALGRVLDRAQLAGRGHERQHRRLRARHGLADRGPGRLRADLGA